MAAHTLLGLISLNNKLNKAQNFALRVVARSPCNFGKDSSIDWKLIKIVKDEYVGSVQALQHADF